MSTYPLQMRQENNDKAKNVARATLSNKCDDPNNRAVTNTGGPLHIVLKERALTACETTAQIKREREKKRLVQVRSMLFGEKVNKLKQNPPPPAPPPPPPSSH